VLPNADALLVTLHKSESLLADVPGLRDQPGPVPLGVTVGDDGGLADGAAVPAPPRDREPRAAVLADPEGVGVRNWGADLFLGEADYVEHRGERPIAITWRLRVPMPAADFATASFVQ
jgi:hypothetical protein